MDYGKLLVLTIKNKEGNMKETEFAKILIDMLELQGWETYKEVAIPSGSIDIVAVKDNIYIGLETKTVLNDSVLSQAHRNTKFCNYSFAVIPKGKRHRDISDVKRHFCKSFGIGVLSIKDNLSKYSYSSDVIKDVLELNHTNRALIKPVNTGKNRIKKYLIPEQKDCIAGSQSGGVITQFKQSMTLIKLYAEQNNVKNKKEIWTALKDQLHWQSVGSMNSALNNLTHVNYVLEASEAIFNSIERYKGV